MEVTVENVELVREFIGEPNDDNEWTDIRISGFIDRAVNTSLAAADIWGVKAGHYAGLVNVAESGSSRSLGDLLSQAQQMEKYYRARGEALIPAPSVSGPVIRRLTRDRP